MTPAPAPARPRTTVVRARLVVSKGPAGPDGAANGTVTARSLDLVPAPAPPVAAVAPADVAVAGAEVAGAEVAGTEVAGAEAAEVGAPPPPTGKDRLGRVWQRKALPGRVEEISLSRPWVANLSTVLISLGVVLVLLALVRVI